MSEEERRVLDDLEAQFEDKGNGGSVLDQSWVGPAGWAALVLGLISVVGLLTTSAWLSYGGVILAGIGVIMVHRSMSHRWSVTDLRSMIAQSANRASGESHSDEP